MTRTHFAAVEAVIGLASFVVAAVDPMVGPGGPVPVWEADLLRLAWETVGVLALIWAGQHLAGKGE